MITVRTKRKIGMAQQVLSGGQEESFVLGLGQNFLDFVDKYSNDEAHEESLLYTKMKGLVGDKDYDGIKSLLSSIQVFGTYDKYNERTIKYKNIVTACGNTYNGTVYVGTADEQSEIERIVAHTCGMCSPAANEMVGKLLA